jgi:hypothetical protein
MAAPPTQPETVSTPKEKEKNTCKHMMIIDDLLAHIGNILACDIGLDKDEKQFNLVVFPPCTRGRPLFMKKLAEFLNNSQHKDAVNRKTNGDTVLENSINLLREIRIMNDQNAGISSVPDNRSGGWRVDDTASSIQERSQFELDPRALALRARSQSVRSVGMKDRVRQAAFQALATSGMQSVHNKCFINQSPE